MENFQHWQVKLDNEQVLWLSLDRAGASVNSMNRDVFTELDQIINDIEKNKPRGVIITSAKKKGFIAGADITQFTALKTADEAFDLIRQAQLVLDKLEALSVPTVAMINGFCMGGGTELALACRYRVALDEPGTRIGLPEVKLGIHPGWGGTVRLPRLVGAIEAMKMILPGAAYPAKKAYKIGMVDAAVPMRELSRAAKYFVMHAPKPHQPSFLERMSNASFVRPMLGKMFYQTLAKKKVNESHYPAPYAVVRQWIKDGAKGDQAMENEARSIAKLMITDTAKNLVRVFFLQNQLKGLAKGIDFTPKHVHVIGAGVMGGDIAAWCALKGMHVTLQDTSPEKIAPALARAYKLYKHKLKKPRLVQAAMDLLQPDESGLGVARADVIIEAIFENLEAKQALFKDLESTIKPETVLASNTSSIPLEDIASVLKDPSRLVGIHFFNPVAKMPLVEVVRGKNTDDEMVKRASVFVGKISRFPLPVASRPGFLINRILMPYLMEAMQLHQEGASIQMIDQAAMQFGMPMGPVQLADMAGLDVCLSVAKNLCAEFGGDVPKKLEDMVAAGYLGAKSGRGFYAYKNGKPVIPESKGTEKLIPDLCDRLVLRMLNEAAACLHEKIIDDQDLLDAGMIFGTGFAPFRGGPIQYAKTRGVVNVVSELERFSKEYGERFKPFAGWALIAEKEKSKSNGEIKSEKRDDNEKIDLDLTKSTSDQQQ